MSPRTNQLAIVSIVSGLVAMSGTGMLLLLTGVGSWSTTPLGVTIVQLTVGVAPACALLACISGMIALGRIKSGTGEKGKDRARAGIMPGAGWFFLMALIAAAFILLLLASQPEGRGMLPEHVTTGLRAQIANVGLATRRQRHGHRRRMGTLPVRG